MRIWAWGTVAVSVFSLAVVACGSSGGSNTGGSGTGGQVSSSSSSSGSHTTSSSSSSSSSGAADCGSYQYSSDATCQDCATTNCCAELKACDTCTACDMFIACFTACNSGDTTCQMGCASSNQTGYNDAVSMINCVAPQNGGGACDMECGSAAMGVCDSGLTTSNATCDTCLGTNCCTEYDACVADAACKACITGTGTGCDTNTLYQAAVTCRTNSCKTDCGGICDSGLTTHDNACDACLGTKCCDAIDACVADDTCLNTCLTAQTPPASCDTNTLYQATKTCWNTNCSGASDCNGML